MEINIQIDDLMRAEKYEEAQALAKVWVEQEPQNSLAWNTLSHMHLVVDAMGDFGAHSSLLKDAESAILKAQALSPKEIDSFFTLARIKFNQDKIEEAEQAFKKTIDISIEENDIYYLSSANLSYAYCLFLLGKIEAAKKIANKLKPELCVWLGDYVNAQTILNPQGSEEKS